MHLADVAQMMMYEKAELMTAVVKWSSTDPSPTCHMRDYLKLTNKTPQSQGYCDS
jgi:hypothetical protein